MMSTSQPAPFYDLQRIRRSSSSLSLALRLSAFVALLPSVTFGQSPAKSNTPAEWGETAGGLQMRVIAVAPDADEQKPDIKAPPADKYSRVDDVTLIVELNNVGNKPVSLQGTRYGDSVGPPYPGKSESDNFAPYLFECDLFDSQGKPIDRPERKMLDVDAMLTLSSGSAETIDSGHSLAIVIHPLRWDASLARRMTAGNFAVRVHYRGPSAGVTKEMRRTWPDKPLASVWSGDVVSPMVPIKIVGDRENQPPELVWSEPVDGMQAAVEFAAEAKTAQARRDTVNATFPFGTRLAVHLHVKNAGDKAISFSSETWRQYNGITLIDEVAKETQVAHSRYSGWPRSERWTLKPGQVAVLTCITLGIAADDETAKNFEHPIAAAIMPQPGKYWLRYELSFGGQKRTDKDGKQLIPGENDWQGSLSTGATMIRVRARRSDDD
jgi:hypothetical protein